MNARIACRLAATCCALIFANFIWQAAMGQHWDQAVERSFFQTVALVTAYFSVVS